MDTTRTPLTLVIAAIIIAAIAATGCTRPTYTGNPVPTIAPRFTEEDWETVDELLKEAETWITPATLTFEDKLLIQRRMARQQELTETELDARFDAAITNGFGAPPTEAETEAVRRTVDFINKRQSHLTGVLYGPVCNEIDDNRTALIDRLSLPDTETATAVTVLGLYSWGTESGLTYYMRCIYALDRN